MKVGMRENGKVIETVYTVRRGDKLILLGMRAYPKLFILTGPTGKIDDYDIASLSIRGTWFRPKHLFVSGWSIDHFMEFLEEKEEGS